MAPHKANKSSAGGSKKAASSISAHVKNTSAAFSSKPSYLEMVKEAVSSGDHRKGISRQAIKNYMATTYDVDPESNTTKTALKKAIEKGVEEGHFVLANGVTGKVKMASKSVQKQHAAEAAAHDAEEEEAEETDSEGESPKPPPKKKAAKKPAKKPATKPAKKAATAVSSAGSSSSSGSSSAPKASTSTVKGEPSSD